MEWAKHGPILSEWCRAGATMAAHPTPWGCAMADEPPLSRLEPLPSEQAIPARPVRPLAELLILAAPTVAQMISYSLMQYTDTAMLSRVGDLDALAAANAGGLCFALTSLGFGTCLLVNTLVSQSYGAKRFERCGRWLWQGIWFGLLAGLLFLPLAPLGGPIMNVLGHEPALVALEATYVWIVMPFTVVRMLGVAAGQFLLAINRPNLTLVAALVGVGANIVLNYLLIFGNLGFPELGLAGAAWGTVLGGIAETAVLFIFAFAPSRRETYGTTQWRFHGRDFVKLLRLGLPSGTQMTADVTAWTLFSFGVMATFGTPTMTANAYMFRYAVISFMPAFGISAAVTALVGRYLGAGDPDTAEKRAHLGFFVVAGYMLFCGVIYFTFGGWLIGVFTDDPDILKMGTTLMVILAIYQFFDAMYINYLGALRGAGDTFLPSLVTIALCWGFMLGLGWLVAIYLPRFGYLGPWTVTVVYGVLLGGFMFLRFRTGAWRRLPRESDDGHGFEAVLEKA